MSKDNEAVAQIVRNNIGAADIVGRGAGMLSLEDNEWLAVALAVISMNGGHFWYCSIQSWFVLFFEVVWS